MQLTLLWESCHAFHSLLGESSENGLYWIDCSAELTRKYVLFPATDLLLAWNPICLGLVEGVIGKVQLHTGTFFLMLLMHFGLGSVIL